MRPIYWASALVFWLAAMTPAQDVRKADDWKKMYDDASAQLRAAQDRKAELAAENARLTTRLADTEKQLQDIQTDALAYRTQTNAFAEQIVLVRAFYSGWEPFNAPITRDWQTWRSLWACSLPAVALDDSQGSSAWPLLFP